jgi:hypothetical protein
MTLRRDVMNLKNNYRLIIKLKKEKKDRLTPGDFEEIKRELKKILTEEAGITECSFGFAEGIIEIKCRIKAIDEERGRHKSLSILAEMHEVIPELSDFIVEICSPKEIHTNDHL